MNIKTLMLILTLAFNLTVFSQDDSDTKWESQIFIDLNASNKS